MQDAHQYDRLRYCYWAGRWHLLEHRVGVVRHQIQTLWTLLIHPAGIPASEHGLFNMSKPNDKTKEVL